MENLFLVWELMNDLAPSDFITTVMDWVMRSRTASNLTALGIIASEAAAIGKVW